MKRLPVHSLDPVGLAEFVRDTIAAALVPGTNVTISVDDAGDTITVGASGGGGGGGITDTVSELVPLTTSVNGVPQLVWEADDSLSLTEVPL